MKFLKLALVLFVATLCVNSFSQEKKKAGSKTEPVKLKKVDPQKSQIKQVKVVAEPQKSVTKK
ncbi:MAG: hypothetical protein R2799_04565 [Crocinitomicaceae bacterium]